ncbi:MAG: PD-(D/E)XK nuclease family protein, partial [Firmicutes bacterium]|nr:PD-(D/E)XK nuclease family protein [Bacillota bacterium]
MRIEELLKKQTDKTKIIITDSVKNINRMIRKCNAEDLYKFNIKVMSFSQIAKECAAEKAAESNVIPQFLENIEYTAIIGRLLGSGSYGFIQKQNYCFDAYNEILKIINQIRMNRLKGKNEKISEINKLIAAYETELENNNEYDVCRMLHEVRKKYDNAEFALAFSRKLTLLEKRAAEILSGKSYDDIDKIDMYDKINYDNVDFVEVYGKANEVKAVVDDIAAKAPTLDNVTLYYTADEYENIIAAQFGAHNIPYRFETGVRGLSNDYIRLMYDILLFVKNGWEYKGLECAVLNPAAALGSLSGFDREISTGYGRDRYQKYTEMHDNKIQRFLGDLYALFDPACFKSTDVLFNAFLDLLNKKNAEGEQYTAFDKRVARVSFENTLKYMRIMPVDSFDSAIDVMLECLEKMRVIYKAPEGAYVSAVRYNGYNMAEKNFNYIVGLSSRQFLSQQIQSPLLSDIELEEYVENPELSRDKNLNKNNSLRQTLASNDKARFMLVYSTYDAAEQKIMSPASIYINLLAESGKKREDCVYRTSYNHFYGHVEADPRKIDLLLSETAQPAAYEPKRPEEFSASVINELLECSIKFYFEHIKGQPKLEYIRKNPDEWLNAMNKGTFYHKVLELYVENAIKTGKKEFDAQVFDDAFNTAIA